MAAAERSAALTSYAVLAVVNPGPGRKGGGGGEMKNRRKTTDWVKKRGRRRRGMIEVIKEG